MFAKLSCYMVGKHSLAISCKFSMYAAGACELFHTLRTACMHTLLTTLWPRLQPCNGIISSLLLFQSASLSWHQFMSLVNSFLVLHTHHLFLLTVISATILSSNALDWSRYLTDRLPLIVCKPRLLLHIILEFLLSCLWLFFLSHVSKSPVSPAWPHLA